MKQKTDSEIEYQETIGYSDDVQYENAVFAIGRVETDKGGLTLNQIWIETENLRRLMQRTPVEKRPIVMADSASRNLLTKYKDESDDPERTQMCILIMFALRLIKASKTIDDNPNKEIIREIVRLVSYRVKRDEEMMKALQELVKTIDKDGDEKERRGHVIEFGVNILSNDDDWNRDLRIIVEKYKQLADKANIIGPTQAGDAFDAVWDSLLADDLFTAEMRESSLGQSYNLLLIFSVYGLMFPWAYSSRIRGAIGIAKTVGHNPEARNKDRCYSKDYFNINEIKKLKQGIKSDQMLKHILGIINKHKPQ